MEAKHCELLGISACISAMELPRSNCIRDSHLPGLDYDHPIRAVKGAPYLLLSRQGDEGRELASLLVLDWQEPAE
jgi:hypothetical protein